MIKVRIEKNAVQALDSGRVFMPGQFNPHESVFACGTHEGTTLPKLRAGESWIIEGWYFSQHRENGPIPNTPPSISMVELRVNDLLWVQTALMSLLASSGGVETALYERGRFLTAFLLENTDEVEIRVSTGPVFGLHVHLYGRISRTVMG